MMVKFSDIGLGNSAAVKGNAEAAKGSPNSGFAALFAAVQPQANQFEQVPTEAQLQQLAKNLNANEQQQLLEQTELSPEAIAQILAQLQQQQAAQQQPLTAQNTAATATEALATSVASQPMTTAAITLPTPTQSQPITRPNTPQPQANTPLPLSATAPQAGQDIEHTKRPQPPVYTTPVAPTPAPSDARGGAQPVNLDLKPVDHITPIDTAQPKLAATPSAAATSAPSMTASIVMIDAPTSVAAQSAPATPSTTAATASLAAPVGSQAWANQLQQNVMQMVMHNQNEMTLRLHPAELGPLQVQLRMDDTTAQLSILTHSQQVRGALEQALPTLRDALANQGIQLGESNVNDQGQQFAQQQARQQAQQWAANSQNNGQLTDNNTVENSESAENTDMGLNSRHTAAARNGQVDTFA